MATNPLAVLTSSLNAGALALRPFTITRTRLWAHVKSDQAATTEVYGCGLGAAVVSDQASAIGVTAVPTPVTDQDSDLFFLYETFVGELVVSSAIGIYEGGNGRGVDSRAMRKVEDGSDVVFVLETMSSPVAGTTFDFAGRMLIKLH